MSRTDLILALYIVSFSLFIYGLMGLTGPRTAVRGNRIAAVGMAIAIIATLLIPGMGNWGLIILGVAIGTAIGVPAARTVKMTQMPQMVALFNGVGGGAVALIAWVEFRSTGGYADAPTYVAIFSLFGAIVGSVSFWGSNIAFAKLQEILPGRPITVGPGRTQQLLNLVLLLIAVGCAVAIVAGSHSEALILLLLVSAGVLGNFVVLPIGGADMPVVISLLNAFTGLSAAATGIALNNTSLIVAGMIVGASGTDPHEPHGHRDEPLDPEHHRRRLRRRDHPGGVRRGRRRAHGALHQRLGRGRPDGLRQPGRDRARATAWPSRRPSTPCAR